jgi:hypothetical protein
MGDRMTLREALKTKFDRQMKRGGYGTMSAREALRLSRIHHVSFEDVREATKRFGVLVDDPYAERITNYNKGSLSPHGACHSTITGEVLCASNVGEAEDRQPWAKGRANMPETDFDGAITVDSGKWTQALFPALAVSKILENPHDIEE